MGLLYTNYSANPITNNSISINSVSGTLSKTFKDSFFVRFHQNSELAKRYLGIPSYRAAGEGYKAERINTVVLQTMLCGDKEFLCEVIDKDIYDNMYSQDNQLKEEEK